VLYAKAEAEGTRLRNPYDTIVEGIGLNRLTANFDQAQIDSAMRGSDQEAVSMVCRATVM
jgi:cysteine synthase